MSPRKSSMNTSDQPSNAVIYELLKDVADDVKSVTSRVSDLAARTSSLETNEKNRLAQADRWYNNDWPAHTAYHVREEARLNQLTEKVDALALKAEGSKIALGIYVAIAGSLGGSLVGVVLHFVFKSV
jgi:hypothetical protein